MAAKVVQVSDDNGATWHTLPGGTGNFNRDAGQIKDTIFGQTLESNEAGIIRWTLGANALYKGFAGYVADIKKPGTPTAATGEACTLVSGKTYQINNTAKRVWDRTAAIVVYDGGVDHTADVDSYDYLFGKVTFDSGYTVGGSVTVDVTYLPMVVMGKANSFTLTQTAAVIDNTDMPTAKANGGYGTCEPGLRVVSFQLQGIYALASGLAALLQSRDEIVLEVCPDGNGKSIARGFFRGTGHQQSGDVGALEQETFNLSLNVPSDINPVFSWNHASDTTLHISIRKILQSWLDQTIIDVRYLSDGVNGDKGDAMVSNVTLTGGLEAMNTFAADFTGSGAPVAVP